MTSSPAARSFEYWLHSAKHAWRASLLSSVLSPVLYLAALGVGLGALVDRGDPSGLGGVSYLTFVAPGLLAATAMQLAAGEAGQPVRGAFQFTKAYHAMLATPLDVRDVLHGRADRGLRDHAGSGPGVRRTEPVRDRPDVHVLGNVLPD
jgi:lipooligosaccharide transport system permease protein